jgi:hypothetical protein
MNPEHDKPTPDAVQPGPPPLGGGAAPENGTPLRPDRPPDNDRVTAARPSGTADKVAAGPPHAPAAGGHPAAPAPRTEGGLLVRQVLGLLLILVSGWGFIALVGYLAATWKIGLSFNVAAAIAAALSLCFFLALEQNLWLSRFMGLRLSPRASPVTEALFFWFFGFVALLLRPTAGPEAAAAAAPSAAAGDKSKAAPPETQDGFREIVETIVFVVVLVLLLKAFVAEAFVIPTGSMATTLYGYHRNVTCPQCGHQFPINMSDQLDRDRTEPPQLITGCTCPNCFFPFDPREAPKVPEVRQP